MNIKQWFSQLSEREQRMLSIAGGALLIFIFYMVLWRPLNQSVLDGQQQLAEKQKLYQWVENNAVKAAQLQRGHRVSHVFRGSLTQKVNQLAQQYHIAVSRMQPQDKRLQVWVDEASFDGVLAWLQGIESSGITILDVDLAETNQPGIVKVRRLMLGKS